MTKRFSLASLLLFGAAAPMWAYLVYITANSPGFGGLGYFIVPPVLCVATAAIYRLTDRSWFGLALASLLAVVVLYGSLLVVAAWSKQHDTARIRPIPRSLYYVEWCLD